MRGLFRYDYTTANYVRYVSEQPDGRGKYAVVYVPIMMLRQDWKSTTLQDFILTNSPNPTTGYRDPSFAPEMLPYPLPQTQNIRLLADRVDILIHERQQRREEFGTMSYRVKKLEIRQGILFQAVEKIIKWMRSIEL